MGPMDQSGHFRAFCLYRQIYFEVILGSLCFIHSQVLKLFAWELPFMRRVEAVRDRETRTIRNLALLKAAVVFLWILAPFLVSAEIIHATQTVLAVDLNT